jgi:hypothetical protein
MLSLLASLVKIGEIVKAWILLNRAFPFECGEELGASAAPVVTVVH